jgi:hypothetical protein
MALDADVLAVGEVGFIQPSPKGKHWILARKPTDAGSAEREPGAAAPPRHEHTSFQARGSGLVT